MISKIIIIRYGEMMLKGKNLNDFVKKIKEHLKEKLSQFKLSLSFERAKAIIKGYNKKDYNKIIESLNHIPGLHSYSTGYLVKNDYKIVKKSVIKILNEDLKVSEAFKISAKRVDKLLPYTSQGFAFKLANDILPNFKDITPNLKNPKDILYIELRTDTVFLYFDKVRLLGGKPSKSAGKGILLLSGGIDSPVAAIETIKAGVNLSLIHFESSPLTPIESLDKVIELSKIISNYQLGNFINLYIVPFCEIHEDILKNIPDSYIITIMRRMMYKITSSFISDKDILAIFNGDSLGQVASQTLESISTIDKMSNHPIIRPLATMDKEKIIELSKQYKTYNTSIIPFSDCCTVYVPKSPTTKPKLDKAIRYEKKLNNKLIAKTIKEIVKIPITNKSPDKISKYGLTFKDAIIKYRDDNK